MNNQKKILVTGGTGYIGSHAVIALHESGFLPIIVDNLSNSNISILKNIKEITGQLFKFYNLDIRNEEKLSEIFLKHKIDAVIHFAGLKSVSESINNPDLYEENNVIGTKTLLKVMSLYRVQKIIFSSSATVYGLPMNIPVNENHPLKPINPYGATKLKAELLLRSYCETSSAFKAIALRYFNPIGAHSSGIIGELPQKNPNNLMPKILDVAVGIKPFLEVFGNDYNTEDGTGVRDYIHVSDLIDAHLSALDFLNKSNGFKAFNIGTGFGTSVLELINVFKSSNHVDLKYKFSQRREGDADACYADPSLANQTLGWRCKKSLTDMCLDSWRWKRNTLLEQE